MCYPLGNAWTSKGVLPNFHYETDPLGTKAVFVKTYLDGCQLWITFVWCYTAFIYLYIYECSKYSSGGYTLSCERYITDSGKELAEELCSIRRT